MIGKQYKIRKWYAFRTIKVIDIPFDETYYVLKDINNHMFLLPCGHYNNYDISLGSIIICRIDKINCTGRIFLEPVHPYYNEGEVHEFRFVKNALITRKNNNVNNVVIVEDDFGYEAIVINENNDYKSQDLLKCRIDRIKKGKLFLNLV